MQRMIEIIAITILIINIMFLTIKAMESQEYEEEPVVFKAKATAYCTGKITATGCEVREGIIAGKPEWFGRVAAIYECKGERLGDFLGYYECLDTGGESIKNGEVIDIYNPSYEWCIQFGSREVFIVLIDGKG